MQRIVVLLLMTIAGAAQGIGPTEIQVKSHAYVPPSSHVLRVDTNLVEIGVVVRDGHRRAVSGLTKDNFQIHDNGKKREIEGFAVDSIAPVGPAPAAIAPASGPKGQAESASTAPLVRERFIALYIDDVNAKDGPDANDLKQTQDAAVKYLKESMQPGVHVGVFTASGAQRLDFSTDLAKLIETIEDVQPHVRLSETACVTPYMAYLVVVRRDPSAAQALTAQNLDVDAAADQCRARALIEAEEVWRQAREVSAATLESIGAVADHLGTMPGSRVLLLASSGFITATLETERDRLINRALHAGVVINALDSKGLFEWLPPHTREYRLTGNPAMVAGGLASARFETTHTGLRVDAMNETSAALAEGTGGVFFHDNNDLHAGLEQTSGAPEVTYRLSFRPQDIPADGAFHKLKVTVENVKSASVQARPGYFAPTETTPGENAPSKFDTEVVGTDTLEEIPIEIGAEREKVSGNQVTFAIVVKIDISKLGFKTQQGRWTEKLRLVSALTDDHGVRVAAKEATMDLTLKEPTYNRLTKSGLNAKLTFQVPAGVYELREVVEDAEGKIASSTKPIEIK